MESSMKSSIWSLSSPQNEKISILHNWPIISILSVFLTFWAGIPLLLGREPAARKPNILLLLADDAGCGDFGVSGNNLIKTPHIDSLATGGVSLKNFYVCPVCSPTRAELLTGRWYPRTGVTGVSTGQERLNLNESLLPQLLKTHGYKTGIFGKWHNGSQWPYHPMARGFDEFYGYTSGHWGEYQDPPMEHNGRPVRGKGYIVDLCVDQALDFIKRNQAEPFFCYVPFTTPHSPWKVPEEDWQRWQGREITQLPSNGKLENPEENRVAWAMVENQDRNIGRLLETLSSLKLEQDTLVIYLSDNGPNTNRWNMGLKGRKGGVDEGGHKTVCFWRWPGGLPAGRQVDQIASSIDLLPTLCGLMDLRRTTGMPLDGMDLSTVLKGAAPTAAMEARSLFTAWGAQSAIRTTRWRLVGKDLYDLHADPGQTKACQDEQQDIAAELTSKLANWKSEMGLNAARRNNQAVDARPLPVGYPALPRTWLPARDATPHGEVRRSSNAPNSSYFVSWTKLEDFVSWDLDVHQAGNYHAELLYTCPEADAGAVLEFSLAGAEPTPLARCKVAPGWDPPLYTNQDTIPRPAAESKMKEFRPLDAGLLKLPKGRITLRLQAKEIPAASVMHLRALTLTLQTATK